MAIRSRNIGRKYHKQTGKISYIIGKGGRANNKGAKKVDKKIENVIKEEMFDECY